MFKDKELIIFDMDGTLIDSVPSLAYAINFMLQKLNKATFSEEIIRQWSGNWADILVKRALSGKIEYESESIDEGYFQNAKEIFLEFDGKNVNAKTPLYPNVNIYLGGGSVAYKKPHPLILHTICNKLNITESKSVMVGDSKSDILAAKSAKIDSIALTYGYNQGANLKELNPTVTCNSFSEILNFF